MRRLSRCAFVTAAIAAVLLLIGPAVMGPVHLFAALNTNLVSYWTLSEASSTRVDSHIHGYNLTPRNSTTTATGLVYGTAVSVAGIGTSDYLDVADNADLSGGANKDYTVAAFVYLTNNGASGQILGKGKNGAGGEYSLSYNAGTNRWRFNVYGSASYGDNDFIDDGGGFGGGSAPSLNTWVLVVGWHDGTNDQIGIATSTNSLTSYTYAHATGVYDSTGTFMVGRGDEQFPSYFIGRIGPVMFWDRVLSGADITALWNSGAGVTYAAMTSAAATCTGGLLMRGAGGC